MHFKCIRRTRTFNTHIINAFKTNICKTYLLLSKSERIDGRYRYALCNPIITFFFLFKSNWITSGGIFKLFRSIHPYFACLEKCCIIILETTYDKGVGIKRRGYRRPSGALHGAKQFWRFASGRIFDLPQNRIRFSRYKYISDELYNPIEKKKNNEPAESAAIYETSPARLKYFFFFFGIQNPHVKYYVK